MFFNESEKALALQALEAGRDYFALQLGPEARPRDDECAAFALLIREGEQPPAVILHMICYGLERMFWTDSSNVEGVPALLCRLEAVCGYRRYGISVKNHPPAYR